MKIHVFRRLNFQSHKIIFSLHKIINLRLHKLKLFPYNELTSIWNFVLVPFTYNFFLYELKASIAASKHRFRSFRFHCKHHNMDRKTIAKVFNLRCLCKVRKCWLHKSDEGKENEKVLVWTLILFPLHCSAFGIKTNPHGEFLTNERKGND